MRVLAAILALTLAGCTTSLREAERSANAAAAAQDALAGELAGLVPGQPSACLPQPGRVQLSSRGFGSTIVYEVSRDLKYRNDTTGGCEGVGRGDILVTSTPTGRVCRGAIARTVDRGSAFHTGSCALGDFVPYRRP